MSAIHIRNGAEQPAGKLVCVGRNYAKHAEELGNTVPEFPLIFLKPASVMIQSGEKIVHPDYSSDMHHEIELVLLIGKTVKNLPEEEALDAVSAYAIGLDMTLRDIQSELKKKGHPWTIAKCFDTAAVVSDFVTVDEHPLSLDMTLSLKVNNEVRQESALSNMIFKPAEVISYISHKMTLEAGDLIFTGTPEGVSRVQPGDILEGKLGDLLTLKTVITQ